MHSVMPPRVKGWCPGAHRPMMSADGLVMRVRPYFARFDAAQIAVILDVARRFGRGLIDITNRANLQIRGIDAADHAEAVGMMAEAGLLDADPVLEARRNILVAPDWAAGDTTHQITERVLARLMDLPDLPPKMGIAVDCGAGSILGDVSADFRFERAADGGVILRADGAREGMRTSVERAAEDLIALANWFYETRPAQITRMRKHLKSMDIPRRFVGVPRAPIRAPLPLGVAPMGAIGGLAFGQVAADHLAAMMQESGARALRITPWKRIIFEGAARMPAGVIAQGDDPILTVEACPGAPFCAHASVPTRDVARALVPVVSGKLHVSGCAKGCGFPRRAALTLVGRDGAFDLIRNGSPWDAPDHSGIAPNTLLQTPETLDGL